MPQSSAGPVKATAKLRQSKAEREAAILTAARQVFEQSGYEKATVADIAEAVGVVEGTVFHYFGSKRALLSKAMEAFYEQIIIEQQQALAGVEGTHNRLLAAIRYHLQLLHDHAGFCGVIVRESRGVEPELTENIRALNRRYTGGLLQLLKEGVEAGEVRDDVPLGLVRNTVYGSMEQSLWARLNDGQAIEVEATAQQLAAMTYRGIAKQPAGLGNAEVVALVRRLQGLLDA